MTNCPHCESNNVKKFGIYYGKQGEKKQRYGCLDCKDNINRENPWTFYENQSRHRHEHSISCPGKVNEFGERMGCGSTSIVRKGKINGQQRLQCTVCSASFSEPTDEDIFKDRIPTYEEISGVNPTVSFEEYKVMKQDLIEELKREKEQKPLMELIPTPDVEEENNPVDEEEERKEAQRQKAEIEKKKDLDIARKLRLTKERRMKLEE